LPSPACAGNRLVHLLRQYAKPFAGELPQPIEVHASVDREAVLLKDELRDRLQHLLRCADEEGRVVDALRPPALDELGLVGAVRAPGASLACDLRFDVVGPPDPQRLPAAVETAAYRIAVEVMTNALRHSQAQVCAVSIEVDSREVRVNVRDDGIGLDPTRAPTSACDQCMIALSKLAGDAASGRPTAVEPRLL
jgi:signal transduction histidine kinase